MADLEKTLEEVKPINDEEEHLAEKPIYRGLRLIEDRPYAGGTSIRYWM